MSKIRKKSFINEALAEQLKSQGSEDGLEKGGRGTVATEQQIVGYRRRQENILVGMIKDVWYSREELTSKPSKKQNIRKRKRGPRSQEAMKRRQLKFNSDLNQSKHLNT